MLPPTVAEYRQGKTAARRIDCGHATRPEKMRVVGKHCHAGNAQALKRWLASQVGQPWQSVLGLLTGKTPRNSLERLHVEKTLGDQVEADAVEGGGRAFSLGGRELRPGTLYVNAAGILSRVALKAVVRPEAKRVVTFTGQMAGVGQDAQGQWFEVTFAYYTTQGGKETCRHDVFLNRTLDRKGVVLAYGRAIFVAAKRAMTKADVKAFKKTR